MAVVKTISAWGDAARKSTADLIRFEAMRRMHSLNGHLLHRDTQADTQQHAALADALKEAKLKA